MTSRPGLVALLSLGLLAAATRLPALHAQSLDAATAPDALARARQALGARRPWQATRLLAPALADPDRRTPEAVLLAAQAAAGWEGWTAVQRLLRAEPWLDTLWHGEGRALLARAALERGQDSMALNEARRALQHARTDAERGSRLVLLARALDRRNDLEGAADAYRAAADLLPPVADWLRLRAAGVLRDSAARAALYARVHIPAAQARIRWTEALALSRSGNAAAAAAQYELLGARLAALRQRLALARDSAGRAAIRGELLAVLRSSASAADSREAIAMLDASFAPLTPTEQLTLARRAAAIGMLERAARGFGRLVPRHLTMRDRYTYGTVLARLGRHAEAIRQFRRVTGDLAGAAAYQRARSLLARNAPGVTEALLDVARNFPSDTGTAAAALFLAGDLAVDAGEDTKARRLWLRVAREYPTSPFTRRARFLAAIIALANRETDLALAELSVLSERQDLEEGAAAAYWTAWIERQRGDTAAARAGWRRLATALPQTYYGLAAARRLGEAPRLPPEGAPLPAPPTEILAALDRAELLAAVGMDVEARFELDRLIGDAGQSPDRLLGVASALLARERTAHVISLALRAIDRGAPPSREVARLVYPLPFRDVLDAEASRDTVSPALLAGLIRQESVFDPRATSGAGARGLMQVLPAVGERMAHSRGYHDWDPVLLYQPEVSLDFGTGHLIAALRRYREPAHALAAYNAGSSRVDRWLARPGATTDPELFIERIPYVETRNYVRAVLRNWWMYEALYFGGRP